MVRKKANKRRVILEKSPYREKFKSKNKYAVQFWASPFSPTAIETFKTKSQAEKFIQKLGKSNKRGLKLIKYT